MNTPAWDRGYWGLSPLIIPATSYTAPSHRVLQFWHLHWYIWLGCCMSSCSSFLTLMYIDIHNFGTYYLSLCSQFKKIFSVNAIEGIIDELYQVFISCRKSCALFIWSESSSLAFKLIFVWKIEMQFYFPKTLHLLICLWRNNFPNLLLPLANCKISRN